MQRKYIIQILIAIILIFFLLYINFFIYIFSKIDINTIDDATLYRELDSIKGIGENTANKVIEYRRNNKPIKIENLSDIEGIKSVRIELIKKKFTD